MIKVFHIDLPKSKASFAEDESLQALEISNGKRGV